MEPNKGHTIQLWRSGILAQNSKLTRAPDYIIWNMLLIKSKSDYIKDDKL